jgi:hypothetical protein
VLLVSGRAYKPCMMRQLLTELGICRHACHRCCLQGHCK